MTLSRPFETFQRKPPALCLCGSSLLGDDKGRYPRALRSFV